MNDERDIEETLGDLERQVFHAIREGELLSVSDVAGVLAQSDRQLAYTTVMTVMTRLWEKGYLLRQRRGKAYLYQARDHQSIATTMGGKAAQEAIEKYGDLALTGFVRTLTDEQRALVARLLAEGPPPEPQDL